jgi:hypothetical protein
MNDLSWLIYIRHCIFGQITVAPHPDQHCGDAPPDECIHFRIVHLTSALPANYMPKVFVRPRPLAAQEQGDELVDFAFEPETASVHVSRADKCFRPFAGVLAVDNATAYAQAVSPLVSQVLTGSTACCFAYGHTNSGKTHTIFGYGAELGVCQRAVGDLFAARNGPLLVQVRFFELYNGKVFDLLNGRQPGFVRVDAAGVVHVRSKTTMGLNGEVLMQSLLAAYCDSADAVLDVIRAGRSLRAEGTSELHSQSSRSHAVLELEIVTPVLAQARRELVAAKARVVPIGKARDDLYITIQSKLFELGPDGKYTLGGEKTPAEAAKRLRELQNQVKAAEAEAKAAERRVTSAKAAIEGGTLVFVDLAGAEYTGQGLQRSPAELREAREINSSLLALKECIRAQASGTRVPFRNSKLTMLLKEHMSVANAPTTIMIANVSSSAAHCKQATDTIKYAALLADAFKV